MCFKTEFKTQNLNGQDCLLKLIFWGCVNELRKSCSEMFTEACTCTIYSKYIHIQSYIKREKNNKMYNIILSC